MRKIAALSTCAWLLAACGGGGGDSAAGNVGASPEGAYAGTLSGSATATRFDALVLEDGQIWAIYDNLIGNTLYVNGFAHGQGSWNNGTFTASGVKDFGFVPAVTGNLSANFVPRQSLNGSISNASGSIGFSGTAIPASNYAYDSPAVVSDVAGAWSMSSTSGDTIAVSVAGSGSFTGIGSSGCRLNGTLTPRASGKRVFDVVMNFGAAPCALAGETVRGAALYSAPNGGGTQLIVAVYNASRTVGTVAFGLR